MSDTPERIYMDPDIKFPECEKQYSCDVEYVRADIFEKIEAENKMLGKALEIYQRERDRYKHATPEMSGAYFLTGGLGETDDNRLPQFVEIVPAYGCGWSILYEKTDRTIMYEGS